MKVEEFYKYHWKAFEVVEWHNPQETLTVQCAILCVDFNCHTMQLVPVMDIGYEEKEFWTSIELVNKIVKNQKLQLTKKKIINTNNA